MRLNTYSICQEKSVIPSISKYLTATVIASNSKSFILAQPRKESEPINFAHVRQSGTKPNCLLLAVTSAKYVVKLFFEWRNKIPGQRMLRKPACGPHLAIHWSSVWFPLSLIQLWQTIPGLGQASLPFVSFTCHTSNILLPELIPFFNSRGFVLCSGL